MKNLQKGSIVPVVLIVILLLVGGYIFISKKEVHESGKISETERRSAVAKCIKSSEEKKGDCATDLAIKLKDPTICREVNGENATAYYCEYNYMSVTQDWWPKDINLCKSMSDGTYETSYKDNCFRGIAELNFNIDTCKYLSTPVEQASCVVQVNNDTYAKKNLCAPIFKNGLLLSASDCREYVNSLHDINKCKLLTRAQGPMPDIVNECIKVVGGTEKDYIR